MSTSTNTGTTDPLALLTAHADNTLHPLWTGTPDHRLASPATPLSDGPAGPTSEALYACTLLLHEGRTAGQARYTVDAPTAVTRLQQACVLTLRFFPPVLPDAFDRFTLAPEIDHLDCPCDLHGDALRLLDTVQDHLRDAQRGWVDPQVLAGAIADVRDTCRLVLISTALRGTCGLACIEADL